MEKLFLRNVYVIPKAVKRASSIWSDTKTHEVEKFTGLSMGHIYLSHSHSNSCLSQPMGRFPWDSLRNDIPMDKPGNS